MKKESKIYIAGHTGLVGYNLCKKLREEGYSNIITESHQTLDLTRQSDVECFFDAKRPHYVILAAARVGGIQANINYPAQFIYENISIQNNIIHSAYKYGVRKLLFFGSACSYPRESIQPIKEDYLLNGPVEPTNEPYAIAKIAGIKMCQAYNNQYETNFICAIPTNLYGPGDSYDHSRSHVIPALIRKFHEAKTGRVPSVTLWGSGTPERDFLFIDDFVEACLFLMCSYNGSETINVASGIGISIRELAYTIKLVLKYEGEIIFDASKPDGIPKKILDISRINNIGWRPKWKIEDGIRKTYESYRDNH